MQSYNWHGIFKTEQKSISVVCVFKRSYYIPPRMYTKIWNAGVVVYHIYMYE